MDDFGSGFGRRDRMRVLLDQAQRTRDWIDRIVEVATPLRSSETRARHPFCDDVCGECMAREA